jgi:hypothetical protein
MKGSTVLALVLVCGSLVNAGPLQRWRERREARATESTISVKETAPATITTERVFRQVGTKVTVSPAKVEAKPVAKPVSK